MNNEVFLTFDIDWASDEVLDYTLEILKEYSVCATFYVTHDTPLLKKIREEDNWELGIHPNFNDLLLGKALKDYKSIIDELLGIVPEALSTRSHALTQNSLISAYLAEKGIKYDMNVYIPVESQMILQPYNSPMIGECTRLPYFFEDDIWFSNPAHTQNAKIYFQKDGLKIFDFHPIHVFLNTENPARYLSAKKDINNVVSLTSMRNDTSSGARDMLMEVLSYGKEHCFKFKKVSQIMCGGF